MVSEEQNSDIELASEIVPVPQVQPESVSAEVVENPNEETNNVCQGKVRQRKKALHAAILKQMEFYFSDANISKDRFLAGLIKQDPNVDLEIFLRFNKIRSLTTDINRIAKALSKSKLLKVSDDGTKVCRTTPIIEKQNIDECTVYVQRLPPDADHDWLSSIFSEYGPVAYVSIPKFKFNHKIKGFAFVEFETAEAAEKCLKAFRAKGCELPSQTAPTDVLSITTFAEEEKQEQNGSNNTEESNKNNFENKNDEKHEQNLESEKSKNKKHRKRSLSNDQGDSETDQSESTSKRKRKESINNEKDSSTCQSDSNTEEEKQKKRKRKLSLEVSHNSDAVVQQNIKESKKLKKVKSEDSETKTEEAGFIKHEDKKENEEVLGECINEDKSEKKKKKKRKRNYHKTYEVLDAIDIGLQVMGKKDWKRLRNKYLDLQRAKMKQLKQHIRKAKWNKWGDRNKMETDQEEAVCNTKENTVTGLQFIPGVIVQVELNESCVDPQGFKAELKSSSSNIKYIDVKEGSNQAFVRCDSSEGAKALILKSNEQRHFRVLAGEEEKMYWDKIAKDREEKIGNNIKVKQRGRNKLLKKAEKELGKHIRFDEV